jgi:hypothetical protein
MKAQTGKTPGTPFSPSDGHGIAPQAPSPIDAPGRPHLETDFTINFTTFTVNGWLQPIRRGVSSKP